MRKLLFLIAIVAYLPLGAQLTGKKFIDQVATEKTGVKGTVTFDGGTLKMNSFDDLSPNLEKGAEIELLSPKMVKDNSEWNLSHIKVKVIDDHASGKYNGKVGYMYPASTSFSDYANYGLARIDYERIPSGNKENKPDKKFLELLATENLGLEGTVTFDGGTLKTQTFDDQDIHLDLGTKLELLSSRMVRDNTSLNLCNIKVKVIEGPYKGSIGYMYPSSTSFGDYTNYTDLTLDIDRARTSPGKLSTTDFINQVPTEYTGTTGIVTFDGGTLKMGSFDDMSPNLKRGSKIELLSRRMIKGTDSWGLYHVKVKVIDDLDDGYNNGKIGYMYPASTSFSPYADYTAERMNAPEGFVGEAAENVEGIDVVEEVVDDGIPVIDNDIPPDPSLGKPKQEIPDYPTVTTGVKGTIVSDMGDAWAYEQGSDWVTEAYIKTGTAFELLNRNVFYDRVTKYYFIKVKITTSPEKIYIGKTMWLNVEETSLKNRFNKDILEIE